MKLYFEAIKLLFRKFMLRQNTGEVLRKFCARMGIVYIKFAQILATQNYGNIFTEEDREKLSSICDDCNPIPFSKIERELKREYGERYAEIFASIDPKPVGSASISQVHRAMLVSGEDVAVKVKRRDVARNIEKEIRRLKRLVHRFGGLVSFANFTGGDHALDLLFAWIRQEMDFEGEMKNIEEYAEFAASVNGRIPGCKDIKVPKLYVEHSTSNVIVMEFVRDKTINKMELTPENKARIVEAMNSYLKLSFYAMLHDMKIVFHGDPHAGNIYLDADGNVGFLDMGLIFAMSPEDAKMTRDFFLTAYAGNGEKLYDMLVGYGDMDAEKRAKFRVECEEFVRGVKGKDVTYYFTDMMNVCLKYEFVPPNFLFRMAKAFVCLNGINKMSGNEVDAVELLQEQTVEFLFRRSVDDCKNLIFDRMDVLPRMVMDGLQLGVIGAVAKETARSGKFRRDVKTAISHVEEAIDLLAVVY